MREISESKLQEILQGNTENRNLEFKAGFNFVTHVWARERLIRSLLAMSNTRDGGLIMIGVAEKDDGTPDPEGVAKDDLIVFTSKLEDLKTKVESFSSSPVNYEIGRGEIAGKSFVLVTITEFSVRPVICRKNGEDKNGVLEEGAIYVRALKDKPSSVKLVNPVDIQEFLERATDKQISSLHRRGWKHETETMVSNKQAFEKERENF